MYPLAHRIWAIFKPQARGQHPLSMNAIDIQIQIPALFLAQQRDSTNAKQVTGSVFYTEKNSIAFDPCHFVADQAPSDHRST
uniref:Uncharacterized protein n=1 Tax=Steinernema glaseri TaxID=37863 RepID=A0A1I8AFM7_9BILA